MKKVLAVVAFIATVYSCNDSKNEKNSFTVNGLLKNAEDQKIYLEQIYFTNTPPEVLDTAEVKNGKFSISASAAEEGFFRLRLEKMENGFVFVNDDKKIDFSADVKDQSLQGPKFSGAGNASLKSFLTELEKRGAEYREITTAIQQMKTVPGNDSLVAAKQNAVTALDKGFKDHVVNALSAAKDPAVAMFVMGYTRDIDTARVRQLLPALQNKFPGHKGLAEIVASYKAMINPVAQQAENSSKSSSAIPQAGSLAPDFTMNDTEGKPFRLSQLRGKYVLIDFWASWCGPCRGENPNVVAAFIKYSNKNFTILGVSLDEDKAAWMKAIKDDKLAWKHVSDLKGWANATVGMYGYEGIPYNVLLDPQGKIIATELRGPGLENKLAEVLK